MAIAAELMNRGKTLTLRRIVPNDAGWLYAQAYGNAEFMHLFRDHGQVESAAALHQTLAQRAQVPIEQQSYLEMAIVHAQRGPIGVAAAADYSAVHRHAEILLGLCAEGDRHQRYGVEAMMLLVDLLFNRYQLHKIIVQIYGHNRPMQTIMQGLGDFLEGVRREHLYSQRIQGFMDLYVYGILEADFRNSAITRRLSQRLVGRDITQPGPWHLPTAPAQVRSGQFTLGA
jgi:ribosomal-protein-alanine N-acetyltransferase